MAVNKLTGQAEFTIPNLNLVENARMTFSTNEASFNIYNKTLFFKEMYNDTVFRLGNEKLMPYIVLNTGKYRYTYEMKFDNGYSGSEYIRSKDFFESDNFLGFHYFFHKKQIFGIYIKSGKKLKLTDAENDLVNDIDNFIGFPAEQSITNNNSLIGIVDAYKIVEWFAENPEKAKKLSPELQKFKNIQETDNPVVMIAKLKE